MTQDAAPPPARRLPGRVVAAYAILGAPLVALTLPLVVYLPPFYAETVGLPLAAVGAAFTVARLWDLVTDVAIGVAQDRTEHPWGRRKIWIALSLPILIVSAWFLFNPPAGAGLAYLYVVLFVLYIGFTMASVGHLSWGAEIATGYHERSRIHGWREAAAVFGMVAILAVPALVQAAGLGGRAEGVQAMGWFFVVLLVPVAAVTLIAAPEPRQPPPQSLTLKASVAALAQNAALRRALAADLMAGFAPGVTGALFVFFFSYGLGFPNTAPLLMLVYFVAGLIGVPIWMRVAFAIGKHRAAAVAAVYQAVGLCCTALIPHGHMGFAIIVMAMVGIASNAVPFLMRAIMSDVVDVDRLRTGEQRTGLYFGLLLLTSKLGLALAPGLTYPILAAFGFQVSLGADNSATAMTALTVLFVALPLIANVTLAAIIWGFPLDERAQAENRARIDQA